MATECVISGVRNFTYRSRNEFTEKFEEREVDLSHLKALDFYVSYWREGWVGHTFVSFIFDNAPAIINIHRNAARSRRGFDPSPRCSSSSS